MSPSLLSSIGPLVCMFFRTAHGFVNHLNCIIFMVEPLCAELRTMLSFFCLFIFIFKKSFFLFRPASSDWLSSFSQQFAFSFQVHFQYIFDLKSALVGIVNEFWTQILVLTRVAEVLRKLLENVVCLNYSN